ncbi:MAG: recombinase family protein [Planctomycetaceae bacterium]|nr:recombinase family protein [Planctomycetaceae bacterium]
MQKVIGYIRVSTEGQASDGVSLEAQTHRIGAWCEANGYELAGVFSDAGVSGGRADNRPALQDALDAVCRSGGVLVVYSLSRLARSTKDTLVIGERLEKAGADLVSLSERIDTTSAAGKMVFRLLAVMAEFERDLTAERTAAVMAHKRSKGERTGTIPFGFSLSDDGVSLITDQTEQAALQAIQEMREAGMSLRRIAESLTERGFKTKSGGTVWKHSSVQSIINRHHVSAA